MNTRNDIPNQPERQQQLREQAHQLVVELHELAQHQIKLQSDPCEVNPPDPDPDNRMSISDIIALIETAMALGCHAAELPLDPSLFPAHRPRSRPTRAKRLPYN